MQAIINADVNAIDTAVVATIATEPSALIFDQSLMIEFGLDGDKRLSEFKIVKRSDTVVDGVTYAALYLSVAGHETLFTRKLVKTINERLALGSSRFCIDQDRGLYLSSAEMKRVITETLKSLSEKGIELVDDYARFSAAV